MKLTTILPALLLTASASLSIAAAAAPAVPRAVQRSVAAIFGSEKVAIVPEEEGGVTLYEVGAPTRLELLLDARGQVAEIEVKLPIGALPPPVLAAARKALPRGAVIEEAELRARGPRLLYEVEARVETGELELVLDPEGAILSQEAEADDAGDGDDPPG